MTLQTIVLRYDEMLMAAQAGVLRTIENLKKGRRDRRGADPHNGWTLSIEGAMAEYAVAKAFDRHWQGKGNLGDADVSRVIEVRRCIYPYGDLRLHPEDHRDRPYVLVTGERGAYTIRGWIRGGDGMKERYWGSPYAENRPAYWVPQTDLNPPDDSLLAYVKEVENA